MKNVIAKKITEMLIKIKLNFNCEDLNEIFKIICNFLFELIDTYLHKKVLNYLKKMASR